MGRTGGYGIERRSMFKEQRHIGVSRASLAKDEQLRGRIASADRTISDTRKMILEDIGDERYTAGLSGQMAEAIVNQVTARIELGKLRAEMYPQIGEVLAEVAAGRNYALSLLEAVSPGSSKVFLESRQK
jgi:hypothetical protein